MKKIELSQIHNLVKEIILLKKQVDTVEYTLKPDIVTDSVKGSSRSFPYVQHTILITGIDYGRYDRRVKQLQNRLRNRIDELMDRVAEANEYIESIPDSETRMIVQCRYINGLTWEQIEKELYINRRIAQIRLKKWWNDSK